MMHVSFHGHRGNPITVAVIFPSNSQSITLRCPEQGEVTLYTHDRDSLRMVAAAFPLARNCRMELENETVTDQARIVRWIAGDDEQADDPTQHPRMSTAESVEQPELPPLGPCEDCGCQWSGNTLLRGPDVHETGGTILSCATCGYSADHHQPVIWEDGEAAQ
jgi:hypothetical protein